MGIYVGLNDVNLPFYSSSWTLELGEGPVPTLVQTGLSYVDTPGVDTPNGTAEEQFGGMAACYVDSYRYYQDANSPSVLVELHPQNAGQYYVFSSVMNPAMKSVTTVAAGSGGYQISANVLVSTYPGWNFSVFPPYGIPL